MMGIKLASTVLDSMNVLGGIYIKDNKHLHKD